MAIDNKDKVLNVPNLRFPEFTEEWSKYDLSDCSFFRSERINTSELDVENYISTENMLQNFQGISIANSIPDNINVTSFKEGDILISNIRPYLKKVWQADRNGGCSADVFVLKANNTICSDCFLHYLIANDTFINFVMSGAKGVKMPRGDKKQMVTYNMGVPHIKEQNKISRLLDLLNKRIVTQNKIIEQLQSLIRGIYDKTFANFSKYQALSSICKIQKGQQVNGEELSKFGEYYVMNGGIEPSGYYDKYNTMPNTISISEGGNSCGYIQFNTVPFWSGGHCYTLQGISTEYNTHFVHHYLKSKEKEIMSLRIGSGLPNIQKKDLEKFPIPELSLETQIRISDGINKIETKLKQEKNTLSAYQTQKAYLLRNLFI